MKQITLSINALNNLKAQLENQGDGFTIKQLRTLDKIINQIEPCVADYAQKITERVSQAKEDLLNDPNNGEVINDNMNKDLDALVDSEGIQIVSVSFEDEWFSLIKDLWEKTEGFRGSDKVRKLILEVDNAIENAKDITDTAQKNDATKPLNESGSPENPGGETGN